jgi:toxin ParE1/3/4
MKLYDKTQAAIDDWRGIAEYTRDRYGNDQVHKYMSGLIDCIHSAAKNQGRYKDHKFGRRNIRIKHCQKHYIFMLLRKKQVPLIIAIYHERMDLMARVKSRLK